MARQIKTRSGAERVRRRKVTVARKIMVKTKAVATKKGQPERLQLELTHYKQRSNWDCGVSCVLMVLPKHSREKFLDEFNEICQEEGFNKSTWTIDLCYLLRRFNVKHMFYTITLGVDPTYKCNAFYQKVLNKDEERVTRRFHEAPACGVRLQRASVTMAQLLDHMTRGPAIVLTNAKLLTCELCKFNKVAFELRKCFRWSKAYQGHYVVVCGYDLVNRRVYYRNPTFGDRICVISLEHFDQARRSYGTDEDVILIYT